MANDQQGMLVASVLDQLKSDEAVLLMYLAGELPAEDRALVDGRLAADANLRAELDRLRETYVAFADALERDDLFGSNRPVVPEAVAARRVGREMLLWQARRQAMRVAAPASSGPRYPWWVYPVAAAASVVLAFLVWWGNTDRSFVGPDGVRIVLRPYNPQQPDRSQYTGTGAGMGDADPIMTNFLRAELLAEALRVAEPVEPAGGDWDDSYLAAVDPNVMLGLFESEAAEENEAAPNHDDTFVQ